MKWEVGLALVAGLDADVEGKALVMILDTVDLGLMGWVEVQPVSGEGQWAVGLE
jgi:hypothetical protein